MTALHILDAGLVTAVGLDCASSVAAMRARLDGFSETRFRAPGDGWLTGAPVPLPRPWVGPARMARLLAAALAEILRRHPGAASVPILLCLAEPDRPGPPVADPQALMRQVGDILGLTFPQVRILAHGRPSGIAALDTARRMLAEGVARAVIVAGLDSYLTPRAIGHYLGENRLLTPDNANGFLPGEAAAAVLCSAETGPLRLTGLGLAREPAFIYNDLGDEPGLPRPSRAEGMTAAYAQALAAAAVDLAHVDYRISDLIGEQYWFRQAALTLLRLERGRKPFQDLWSPTESLGNIGAAVVPVMLAMAMVAARRRYAPGSPVLIEASGDDGACGACVLHEVRA